MKIMKQIHCETANAFKKVCDKLKSLGYKHPNGGELYPGMCQYQFEQGTKYINLYDDSKVVKFGSSKVGKVVVDSETFINS